jgi:hypothetical protein
MDPAISAAGTPRREAGQAPGDAGTTGDGSGRVGMAAAAQRDALNFTDWTSDILSRMHPLLGVIGTFRTDFCDSRIGLIPDFRNRKPPTAPHRHDAEREA